MKPCRALALAATLLLAACGSAGTYYEVEPDNARASIKSAQVPLHVLGSSIASSRVYDRGEEQVVTALMSRDGQEMMLFVTTLVPDGSGVRVETEIEMPEGANIEGAEQRMPAFGHAMAMMEQLANEHVAAAIEGRPFDMMFAAGPMQNVAIDSVPGGREAVAQASEAASMMAETERQIAFEQDYGNEWSEPGTGSDSDWGE